MKGRLLIIIFISICFIAGSCNVSSVQGSRYNFSSLDSVIQGWVSKEYYPGADRPTTNPALQIHFPNHKQESSFSEL